MSKGEEADYGEILKGKTLAVYFFLLEHKRPLRIAEIQRGTSLSSLSLVSYHLNKLLKGGLIEEDPLGGFSVSKVIRVGVVRFFVGSGRLLLPRQMFYALFVTGFLVTSIFFLDWVFSSTFLLLIFILAITACIFWFETIQVWKSRPLA